MNENPEKKILMHACCGPCSIEPYRILKEEGWKITIFFSNDNIYPENEFVKRYETLLDWAKKSNVDVILDKYDNSDWQNNVAIYGEHEPNSPKRKIRCSNCYRQRFERTASWAAENGFKVIGTTLSVSPYQYTEIIEEELQNAAARLGLKSHFVDFSPHYRQATIKSKELGMYRQDYCGCDFSHRESQMQKEKRKKDKEAKALQQEKANEQAKIRAQKITEHNKTKQRHKELVKQYKANNS